MCIRYVLESEREREGLIDFGCGGGLALSRTKF